MVLMLQCFLRHQNTGCVFFNGKCNREKKRTTVPRKVLTRLWKSSKWIPEWCECVLPRIKTKMELMLDILFLQTDRHLLPFTIGSPTKIIKDLV